MVTPRRDVFLGSLSAAGEAAARPRRRGEPVRADQRVFDPRAFDAVGNGINDDTAAFRAMHQAMRRAQADDDVARVSDTSRPPLELVVHLQPGHYRYTWNRWTWGIRRILVLGHGAAIQCLHDGPFDLDQAPLISNRDHYMRWDPTGPAYGQSSSPPPPAEDYGRRIRTARPGDLSVELLSAGDALLFRPGVWVLVQSYAQQQDGYPPNMRHFDRARVVGVDGARVRLDRALRNLHKDDWPEDTRRPLALGRARIVAIDRPDCPFALSQRFVGLTTLSNPNHAVRDPNLLRTVEVLGITGTLRADIRDCTLLALGVSQVGEVHVQDSVIRFTEPDKLVDRLTFRACTINEVRECTGVNQLTLDGCTVETTAQLLARDVRVEACTFPAVAAPGKSLQAVNLEGPTPTRRMAIVGCRFFGTDSGGRPPIAGTVWARYAIDGRALRPLGDGRIEVPAGPAFAALVGMLEEGSPTIVFGAGEPWFAHPRFGRCSGIAGRGDGAVFTFALPSPPRIGDTLAVPRLLRLRVQDCWFAHPYSTYPDPPQLTWEDQVSGSRSLRLALRSDFASRPAWLPGVPRRLRCQVVQPYTGPSEGCFLTLRSEPQGPGALELLVDLKVPGEREIGRAGARLKPGDAFRVDGRPAEHLRDAQYVGVAFALIAGRPGALPAPASGAEAEHAAFLLEVEVDSPFEWALARSDQW